MKLFFSLLLFLNFPDCDEQYYAGHRHMCLGAQGGNWVDIRLVLKAGNEFHLCLQFQFWNTIAITHIYEGWWERRGDTIILKDIIDLFCQTKIDPNADHLINITEDFLQRRAEFGRSCTNINFKELTYQVKGDTIKSLNHDSNISDLRLYVPRLEYY